MHTPLDTMRPWMNLEEVGCETLVEKTSLKDVQEVWNLWEIHCLILLSLFLQVVLFLFAGVRRRSSSSILRGLLWLAYLSADSVAIFVLGHLMYHAQQEPRHQLMYFWAPFVLVHLGGQDTITAFSKQDNELWRRHLLSLVTQAAVALYVVAKAPWSDTRLRAAMVIMFISGCFKYAERTLCLYRSSPEYLSSDAATDLYWVLSDMRTLGQENYSADKTKRDMMDILDMMSEGRSLQIKNMMSEGSSLQRNIDVEIMAEVAPRSKMYKIFIADDISAMLRMFKLRAGRCGAYKCVGACLVECYQRLHTKAPLREVLLEYIPYLAMAPSSKYLRLFIINRISLCGFAKICIFSFTAFTLLLMYMVFQLASAPLALVLFIAAEKGGQHTISRIDIKVTYVLLVGAILLDVCSFLSSPRYLPDGRVRSAVLRVANFIRLLTWSRKQWSEELAQYNMIKAIALLSSGNKQSTWCHFCKTLPARLLDFGITTRVPITEHYTSIKEVVLDNLLSLGARKKWDITSSHDKLALQKWMNNHQNPDSARTSGKALEKSINLDFPITVLIWHFATEMCYFCGDNSTNSTEHMNKDKQVSRELSNYIMYLIFRCGGKSTASSELAHDKARQEIKQKLSELVELDNSDEKGVVMKLFGELEEQQRSTDEIIHNLEELACAQDPKIDNLKKLVRGTLESHSPPLLPRAHEMARELIGIKDAAERWRLIVEVWSEMLYYAAYHCGGAFHYEHLSTGGEFATHVLVLMKLLGPFLPPPGV